MADCGASTVLHTSASMSPVDPRIARACGFAFAAALMLAPWLVHGQTRQPGEVPFINLPSTAPTAPPPAVGGPSMPAPKGSPKDALKQRDQELEAIRAQQKKAREMEGQLRREIEQIGTDRRKLNRQLIDVAARVRAVEQQIAATEERLVPLDEQERTLRASLEGRREVIANVLAVLQRMGRSPPPVLLVKPEDALQSVRTAMLLGAVLPEMRQDVETVVGDLLALGALRRTIASERTGLEANLSALAEDQLRLAALTEQRQKRQADAEQTLAAERQRAAQLGRQAEDVLGLIVKLEQGLDGATRAARVAARGDAKDADSRSANDTGRLEPAIAFSRAQGRLPLPVNGVRIRDFGGSDGTGGHEKGLSIATRPGAQITAPCDGWVVYAGPFRNYGQLLILNAGDGYHVLLAGMERISVDLGQFVVTGEPVAVMGGRVQTFAAIATGSGQPVLYVEFRKDGTPIDPGPWWAVSNNEKVRG
jgi:septal ring factor EnvC (AmiA/AmiB activator)